MRGGTRMAEQFRGLLPKRKKAEQFKVCTKTIDRWVSRGILSKPTEINGRHYFDPDEQPATDRREDAA
jgi:hypothetical protein